MDSTEKLLDKEADKQAELDDLLTAKYNQASEMFANLLVSTDNRDPELFAEFDIDPNITALDYDLVPIFERDLNWTQGFSAMFAACYWQTWLDVYMFDVLELSEDSGLEITKISGGMTKTELVTAGKKGIDRERFKAAKERRKQPA